MALPVYGYDLLLDLPTRGRHLRPRPLIGPELVRERQVVVYRQLVLRPVGDTDQALTT